jgi:adenylosuccinate synthase
MARVGNEFGSVTGRQRRCGWLDLVALKYAVQVNGVTQLRWRGDVLSGFETLKVCTEYNYKGEKNCSFPLQHWARKCNSCLPDFKGWKQDLTGMTTYDELPIEWKNILNLSKRVEVQSKDLSWLTENNLKIIQPSALNFRAFFSIWFYTALNSFKII